MQVAAVIASRPLGNPGIVPPWLTQEPIPIAPDPDTPVIFVEPIPIAPDPDTPVIMALAQARAGVITL